MDGGGETGPCVRVLCSKKSLLSSRDPGLRWLIGSPLFLPPFTIVSSLRCLHTLPDDPYSPDFSKESDEIRALLLKGFDIIGALFVGNVNWESGVGKAVEASYRMRNSPFGDSGPDFIGAAADLVSGEVQFFVSTSAKVESLKACNTFVYEDNPEEYVWKKGCLLRCQLELNLPVLFAMDKESDMEVIVSSLSDAAASKLREPHVVYLVEGSNINSEENSVILHATNLDFNMVHSDSVLGKPSLANLNSRTLADVRSKKMFTSLSEMRENADAIQVTVLSNQSRNNSTLAAPTAVYFPASDQARLSNVNFKIDVLCYASEDFTVAAAISRLVIPGLIDQLNSMKRAILPELLSQHPRLCPYHFLPPGLLHPITAIYDLRYGETEETQVEIRRSLHLRLGLPLDRPLLRTANALSFGFKASNQSNSVRYGSSLLKDVHAEIPSSGVSGGVISLINGSYEYYHYLLQGIDDNGWGCAYRSLQTIISWYRLQQYTSIEVPSHRDIQQTLVEIGDKEPAFVGSREWIGAIELSFVLDKLLGVSCKIINVRSGEDLPEKCRELSLHFETQGTPVMIGGGVLAYTLLGVEYNDLSGDCAFLILDPHYTGTHDLKKIVNGGWCGWKKAVDSKGRSFFLKDKFYNLLLPQRPNMV